MERLDVSPESAYEHFKGKRVEIGQSGQAVTGFVLHLKLGCMTLITYVVFSFSALLSTGYHLSYDDYLEDKGKLLELFCAVLCATVVRNDMHTHI